MCPACRANIGPNLRAIAHLKQHGLKYEGIASWDYPIHSIEGNPEYSDIPICLTPTHISSLIEKCLYSGTGWEHAHNGLMCLWELGIHRMLNANVANLDQMIIPEMYARELGQVLITNLLDRVPIVRGRLMPIPSRNEVTHRVTHYPGAVRRPTIGRVCEQMYRGGTEKYIRKPITQTFCNPHMKFKRSNIPNEALAYMREHKVPKNLESLLWHMELLYGTTDQDFTTRRQAVMSLVRRSSGTRTSRQGNSPGGFC